MHCPLIFYFCSKVRTLNLKFPVEERDTASIVIDHSGPAPDMYDSQVSLPVFWWEEKR